jgi:hypothetical protein
MAQAAGQLLFDESGQPFIVIREQQSQKRLTGIEALKASLYLGANIEKCHSRVTSWPQSKWRTR